MKVTLLLCIVILIPKHSFCNTACVCMVMQIKLVDGVIGVDTSTWDSFLHIIGALGPVYTGVVDPG